MFIERRIHNGKIELWRCQWENQPGAPAKKVFLSKICDEGLPPSEDTHPATEASAICWSYGRTLGNIAVLSPTLLGQFPNKAGDDALLPCDLVPAGKFRHGEERWWCRTHQTHWGIKADLAAFAKSGELLCANHRQTMNYVVSPFSINVNDYAEVGIWCSMPAAISTEEIKPRAPKIHVHVRPEEGGQKTVDRDFAALAVIYSDAMGLLKAAKITQVNITPPAAFEFIRALEAGQELDCINCSSCRYPHLDLGDFARKPHRKHFCGNCGRDSTWSKKEIISTPLKPLHDQFARTLKYETPSRTLDLDQYPHCRYTIWASTPAIIWTAKRPQEFGIHVHVHDGTRRIIDNTFGSVKLNGQMLERTALIESMIEKTVI